jgi:hypothetical protein
MAERSKCHYLQLREITLWGCHMAKRVIPSIYGCLLPSFCFRLTRPAIHLLWNTSIYADYGNDEIAPLTYQPRHYRASSAL